MKGLDSYIMGVYDPNAPFNQVDWTEIFGDTLDKCEWITEGMLNDDDVYEMLGSLIYYVHDKLVDHNKYYDRKAKSQFNRDNADKLSALLKEQWDYVCQWEGKLCAVVKCPLDAGVIKAKLYSEGNPVATIKNGRIVFGDKIPSYGLTTDWALKLFSNESA